MEQIKPCKDLKIRKSKRTITAAKKAHTIKTTIISTKDKKIKFMSYSWVGRTHDFTKLKHEFPPNKQWFRKHRIQLDLAYLGFEKDYICKELKLPKKKPKGQQLSDFEKDENKIKV